MSVPKRMTYILLTKFLLFYFRRKRRTRKMQKICRYAGFFYATWWTNYRSWVWAFYCSRNFIWSSNVGTTPAEYIRTNTGKHSSVSSIPISSISSQWSIPRGDTTSCQDVYKMYCVYRVSKPLENIKNIWFSDVSKGYRKRPLE